MLQKAEPADFLMEMRKVKYKLNYGNSREKEYRKVMCSEERAARNKVRSYQHKRRSRGERPGYISDYEDDPKEDISEPAVHKQDWNEHWVEGADATPRRFVMPGQTPEQLEEEVYRLLSVISRMQLGEKLGIAAKAKGNTFQRHLLHRRHRLVYRRISNLHSHIQTTHPPPLGYGSVKRLYRPPPFPLNVLVHLPKSNSLHLSQPSQTVLPQPTQDLWIMPFTQVVRVEIFPAVPRTRASPLSPNLWQTISLFPPIIAARQFHAIRPIKVRDFAYEAYDGPRGYYVPHPPTEARAAKNAGGILHVSMHGIVGTTTYLILKYSPSATLRLSVSKKARNHRCSSDSQASSRGHGKSGWRSHLVCKEEGKIRACQESDEWGGHNRQLHACA